MCLWASASVLMVCLGSARGQCSEQCECNSCELLHYRGDGALGRRGGAGEELLHHMTTEKPGLETQVMQGLETQETHHVCP